MKNARTCWASAEEEEGHKEAGPKHRKLLPSLKSTKRPPRRSGAKCKSGAATWRSYWPRQNKRDVSVVSQAKGAARKAGALLDEDADDETCMRGDVSRRGCACDLGPQVS